MSSFIRRNGVWIGFMLLAAIVTAWTSSTGSGDFLTARNLNNLLVQASINGVLAAGMTLVILTGGIDLSVGSVVALAGVFAGLSQVHWDWLNLGWTGALGSIAISMLMGTAAGVITGALISLLGIPPFVITLGLMVIARGLALIISDGSGISGLSEEFTSISDQYLSKELTAIVAIIFIALFLYQMRRRLTDAALPTLVFILLGYSFFAHKGLPIPVFIMLIIMSGTAAMLQQTTLGRSIYAVGSNEPAAHWAGVPTRKVKWLVYAMMGALAGLAGVLLTARLNGAVPTAGDLFELNAIAAVVIGGTSLTGGVGTVLGTFVGVLTIETLNNGMDLLSIPSFWRNVVKGLIIIIAVGMDRGQHQQS